MPPRLNESVKEHVRRLLTTTRKSYAQIAADTGVSKMTVSQIDKKLPGGATRGLRKSATVAGRSRSDPTVYERCPTCGGRVIMPCKLCAVRRSVDNQQTLQQLAAGRQFADDVLGALDI